MILLLILVVLLFGSSAVLGMLGWILGFVVAAGALIYASITFDMAPGEVLLYGIGGFIVLIGCFFLVAHIIDLFNPELQKSLRESDRLIAENDAELGRLQAEIDAQYLLNVQKMTDPNLPEFEREIASESVAQQDFYNSLTPTEFERFVIEDRQRDKEKELFIMELELKYPEANKDKIEAVADKKFPTLDRSWFARD